MLTRTIPSTPSLLTLPLKRLRSSISVGTDICHVVRVMRILVGSSPPQIEKAKHVEGNGSGILMRKKEIDEIPIEEQIRRRNQRAFRFAKRLLREEEVAGVQSRLVDAIEGVVRVEREERGLGDVRILFEQMIGGREELAERKENKSGGVVGWETLIGRDGKEEEGLDKGKDKDRVGDEIIGVLELLRQVVKWKVENDVCDLETPWGLIQREIREGKVGVEGCFLKVMDELRKRRKAVLDAKTLMDVGDQPSKKKKKGKKVATRNKDYESGDGKAMNSKGRLGHGSELSHGLHDDINIFLAVEKKVHERIEEARSEMWKSARFLAGRLAAKEALQKAYSPLGRRITFHDIAIIPTPADEHGSHAPKVLVLERDGRSVRECRVSISHDGEYATAVAMVEGDGVDGAGERESDDGGEGSETRSDLANEKEVKLQKPTFMW